MAVTPRKLTNLASITKYFREIQNYVARSTRLVAATSSTLTVSEATHEGKIVTLARSAGIAVTMPAATGSGAVYKFVVKTTAATGNYAFARAASDVFKGIALGTDDDGVPANSWGTVSAVAVTLDGTTRGGVAGDEVEFVDISAGVWKVKAFLQQTGTEATPFS